MERTMRIVLRDLLELSARYPILSPSVFCALHSP